MDSALDELQQLYIKDAIYFHHPKYVAHLNCPVVLPAVLAESIISTLNSSLDTWDQSAGATLIEQKVLDWTRDKMALGSQGDGIFTSGGTQSNLMAILLARDHFATNVMLTTRINCRDYPLILINFVSLLRWLAISVHKKPQHYWALAITRLLPCPMTVNSRWMRRH